MRVFLYHILLLIPFVLFKTHSTPVTEKTIYYPLADRTIELKLTQYGNRKDIVFINLHDDETTSVEAAKEVLNENGGLLIEIENAGLRYIRFRLEGKFYSFDANGIFSGEGIRKNLRKRGVLYNEKAAGEIASFGKRLLQLLPDSLRVLVALHNNTHGNYSIRSYEAGNERTDDAEAVTVNPGEDPDDFFLTTNRNSYKKLSASGYNCVLQDNKHCSNDGSLSYYCGRNNIRYINCETEQGKLSKYINMIREVYLLEN